MIAWLIFFLLFSFQLSAQNLEPAPTFQLLSSGYGAKALGLGGAFVAVADDLSTIYWNPAGLGQLSGIQLHADYRFQGDSDEDFAAEVEPNRFESAQKYSVSGNQLQSASFSYAIVQKDFAVVPAFGWQRLSNVGPMRKLKETAGLVSFIDPRRLIFVQSEGDYEEDFRRGEEEYVFGAGIRFKQSVMIGGTWSFLRGGVDNQLTGNFRDNFIPGIDQPNVRQDIALQQSRKDDLSGSYFRIGMLYAPPQWSLGGYVRLPYTQKSDITLDRTGTVRINDAAPVPLNEIANAKSELNVPAEWGAGISFKPSHRYLIAGSIAYANWQDALLTTTNSSSIILIPETTVSYPTLRGSAGQQHSLLQLRAGTESMIAGNQQGGLALRAGIFWDGQPYANESDQRIKFKGYTLGAGYVSNMFRIQVAWIREKGDIVFTPYSGGESNFVNERWVVSFDFVGK